MQQERGARGVLERELNEIKHSLAWRVLLKFRRLRSRCFPPGTRRGDVYDVARLLFSVLVLFPRRVPQLASTALRILRTEGVSELKRRLWNKVVAGGLENEYPEWIERYATLSDMDRLAIKRAH